MTHALDPEAVRLLEGADQAHLVEHAGTLAPEEADAFLRYAAARPWDEVAAARRDSERHPGPPPVLRPPQALTLGRVHAVGGLGPRLRERGRALVAEGRVATLLLAGGQGTRLGIEGPKGAFVLGPEPDRSLYAIHAERVVAAGRETGRAIPLVVLVSGATEEATRAAFDAGAATWGLEEGQVRFLRQRELPVTDAEGKALLADRGRLAMAPDGHGGALGALVRTGALEDLAASGVDVLTTFQVDNPLGLPLDPLMLGWMVERDLQTVGKAVRRLPDEKVGVYTRDTLGRHRIVEYSEFPDGGMPEDLVMGSIALHAFSVPWLVLLFGDGFRLPFHLARKKVPFLGADGAVERPDAPNGTKLEQFIFDVIPEAERAEVQEVVRDHEFAPVKNAEGVDSPETARALVAAEVRRWHASRGLPLPDPLSLHPLEMVE
jgi:UDP-N-acetylglucosamine/UDP-N-acetylgalactosamine diphosphorylase